MQLQELTSFQAQEHFFGYKAEAENFKITEFGQTLLSYTIWERGCLESMKQRGMFVKGEAVIRQTDT